MASFKSLGNFPPNNSFGLTENTLLACDTETFTLNFCSSPFGGICVYGGERAKTSEKL